MVSMRGAISQRRAGSGDPAYRSAEFIPPHRPASLGPGDIVFAQTKPVLKCSGLKSALLSVPFAPGYV